MDVEDGYDASHAEGFIKINALRLRAHKVILATGIAFAMLPDADVIGFSMGIEYADPWGHRGATHSLAFAGAAALLAVAVLRPAQYLLAGMFLFLSMASHGLLDTLTNGGLGSALFWPFDTSRIFAPITPIAVSPIGLEGFMSERGIRVLRSEAIWIWAPLATMVVAIRGAKLLGKRE